MGEERLDMNTIFRWGWLEKKGVRFFKIGVEGTVLHNDKTKIFNNI